MLNRGMGMIIHLPTQEICSDVDMSSSVDLSDEQRGYCEGESSLRCDHDECEASFVTGPINLKMRIIQGPRLHSV